MKKLVLLTLAATVVAGSAFAAAPVTKLVMDSTKVQADYALNNMYLKVVAIVMMVSVFLCNTIFPIKLQLQYSYDKLNAKMATLKIIN